MEDDIVVDDMPHWTETIQDVVAEAPPDWGILQLWTNNPAFYKYIHQGQSGDQVDTASMGNMSVAPASSASPGPLLDLYKSQKFPPVCGTKFYPDAYNY